MTTYATLKWAEQCDEPVETIGYPDITEEVRIEVQKIEDAMRPPSPLPYDPVATEALRAQFRTLAEQWKRDRQGGSTVAKMMKNPAYIAIVEMGKNAIPLILEELDRDVDFWFGALQQLAGGVNPVSDHSMGNLIEMRDAWIWWGNTLGYYRTSRGNYGLSQSASYWIPEDQQ
jgi:hypothetical protein